MSYLYLYPFSVLNLVRVSSCLLGSHIESRNLKVPTSTARAAVSAGGGGGVTAAAASGYAAAAAAVAAAEGGGGGQGAAAGGRRRAAGAARLFGYLEASDGSGDEYESGTLVSEFGASGVGAGAGAGASGGAVIGAGGAGVQHYARDKENAAPLHHGVHHEQCLRY